MIEVYYIEDDKNIAQIVSDYLTRQGFLVSVYSTIEGAKDAIINQIPAVLLVDWNMPDGSGDALCRWVRMQWRDLPLIFMTVRDDVHDIVEGFRDGADDYIVKPFELEVLYLRIQALLRRAGSGAGRYLSCGGISIDKNKREVFCDGKEVVLSPLEYDLLFYLLQNKGMTVTREQILSRIWDINGNFVNDNTLTVAMKRLREKLHQPSCLKTVRSIGYRMEGD